MPETAPVQGTVRINGKAEGGLLVRFLPEPEEGKNTAFSSEATTDAQGKYVLKYDFDGVAGEGAAIGVHRILVTETGATATGQKVRGTRVPYTYASPASTPLQREVKNGEPQTIDLDVKK